MKKISLLIAGISFCLISTAQVKDATDFTAVDCDGNSHNLFSELDAGKIIVIGWTMPCGTCAVPLLDVHNAVLDFAVSNPGVVEYWVNDDFGDTPCSSIEGWCESSGIANVTTFSSTEIAMSDYDGPGMPKVVVLGCTDRKVYYNVNDFPNGNDVTKAINTALDDVTNSCLHSGVNDLNESNFALECFPNPASSKLRVSFNPDHQENLSIELYDMTGSLLKSLAIKGNEDSSQEIMIDISDIDNGIYFIKMAGDQNTASTRFSVVQ